MTRKAKKKLPSRSRWWKCKRKNVNSKFQIPNSKLVLRHPGSKHLKSGICDLAFEIWHLEFSMSNYQEPRVFLVGAGPGHPGLLTLRAVECLAKADLVIYDRLVSSRLLDFAPSTAERLCVTDLAEHHVER